MEAASTSLTSLASHPSSVGDKSSYPSYAAWCTETFQLLGAPFASRRMNQISGPEDATKCVGLTSATS